MNMDEVERHLANMGYEHPVEQKVKVNAYRTYDEKGDEPYKYVEFNPYKTVDTDTYETPEKLIGPLDKNREFLKSFGVPINGKKICPECENPAVYFCECETEDMMCKERHVWYIKEGEKVVRDPHAEE